MKKTLLNKLILSSFVFLVIILNVIGSFLYDEELNDGILVKMAIILLLHLGVFIWCYILLVKNKDIPLFQISIFPTFIWFNSGHYWLAVANLLFAVFVPIIGARLTKGNNLNETSER